MRERNPGDGRQPEPTEHDHQQPPEKHDEHDPAGAPEPPCPSAGLVLENSAIHGSLLPVSQRRDTALLGHAVQTRRSPSFLLFLPVFLAALPFAFVCGFLLHSLAG